MVNPPRVIVEFSPLCHPMNKTSRLSDSAKTILQIDAGPLRWQRLGHLSTGRRIHQSRVDKWLKRMTYIKFLLVTMQMKFLVGWRSRKVLYSPIQLTQARKVFEGVIKNLYSQHVRVDLQILER